jgi:aminocarboxymuconate-semialdehyde decarboxylase
MLGTDYSFPPADLSPLTTLRQAGFGPRDIEQIAVANPRRMFRID